MIVMLASGGPKMTAIRSDANGIVCGWFSGMNYKTMTFPNAALREYETVTTIELIAGHAPISEDSHA